MSVSRNYRVLAWSYSFLYLKVTFIQHGVNSLITHIHNLPVSVNKIFYKNQSLIFWTNISLHTLLLKSKWLLISVSYLVCLSLMNLKIKPRKGFILKYNIKEWFFCPCRRQWLAFCEQWVTLNSLSLLPYFCHSFCQSSFPFSHS